jgi:NAD(P)-dependent dehydrogenase (short-subunit alcohol dehydrogenase family)
VKPQTWFITGSSRGFGRALVRAALAAGDSVVATARTPSQLDDLAADRLLPVALLLGANAVDMALAYSRRQLEEATEWEETSRSADFADRESSRKEGAHTR